MKKDSKKIFIGVSWPYASGNIHLGHLAGQYVVCDVFARYHRLKGNKVLMVSGSDCHGAPVAFKAEQKGLEPEELAEQSHQQILQSYKQLGFLYENYTKTTTQNHKKVVKNLFLALKDFEYLVPKTSKQYYDPKVERFLPDRYVRGTCPDCGATNARGDECPECGKYLSPEELIDPYSTLSDATPFIKETTHFYLDLTKAEPALQKWLSKQTHWRKWVKEFSKGWLKMGLEPRAITRDFDYGIEIPVEGWEDKVIYVWFEAVIGYLSAAIEWAREKGEPQAWEDFWKSPDCKHYYFLSGGNVPFHTIIWPAEIIAYNHKYDNEKLMKKYSLPGESKRQKLNLPYDVPANKMLTYGGKKMSKGDSVGIGLEKLMKDYHPDVIRYFFVKYAPENHDREYKWKDFIEANNKELVANLGNFINRVLKFTKAKFGNQVPQGELTQEVSNQIQNAFKETGQHIEKAQFIKAIDRIHQLGYFANKYFNHEKPWKTVKNAPEKADNTIFNSIQIIVALQTLLKPFLPFSTEKLRKMLNLDERYDANKELANKGEVTKFIDTWQFKPLSVGHKLNKPDILFEKLEYTEELEEADTIEEEDLVTVDDITDIDFSAVDTNVKIGKIISITGHKNDKNLNVTQISINTDQQLQIVCGADNISTNDIVPVATTGSKVLDTKGQMQKIKQTKIKDTISEGMLCSEAELGVGDNTEQILILPRSLKNDIGTSLNNVRFCTLVQEKALNNIPTAWSTLTNIQISTNRGSELDEWIKNTIEKILKRYKGVTKDEIAQKPIHKAFRELHAKYGHKNLPGSPEEMIHFIRKKEELPNINNLVDLYNAFSAQSGISIGAHDIAKLAGNPQLVKLKQDVPFHHATTNQKDIAQKGEYAYRDQRGILCHMDIKQGNRTKVTKETSDVLILFQGNEALDQKQVDKELQNFQELVKRFIPTKKD